jgi:hypothetical protein
MSAAESSSVYSKVAGAAGVGGAAARSGTSPDAGASALSEQASPKAETKRRRTEIERRMTDCSSCADAAP